MFHWSYTVKKQSRDSVCRSTDSEITKHVTESPVVYCGLSLVCRSEFSLQVQGTIKSRPKCEMA